MRLCIKIFGLVISPDFNVDRLYGMPVCKLHNWSKPAFSTLLTAVARKYFIFSLAHVASRSYIQFMKMCRWSKSDKSTLTRIVHISLLIFHVHRLRSNWFPLYATFSFPWLLFHFSARCRLVNRTLYAVWQWGKKRPGERDARKPFTLAYMINTLLACIAHL